ncbi:universal stress protein [Mesorhizobium sp. BAC0120]|uniref:universal stress protein n=1 Tax=Mesorhizobium sp. BAC0120 TaxID=3090670 RepID=UPI00298CC782|nr:universal stress protein [Mesorhizobium sp. BAC0120]MDW6022171.1 universal stress protein [Mesorhizobium sp. BAC0120]
MYKHILIATDGSELSQKAVAHGIELAAALNARVTALTVTVPYHSLSSDLAPVADIPGAADFIREYLHGQPKLYLEAAETDARAKGVPCETLQVEHDHPYSARPRRLRGATSYSWPHMGEADFRQLS